MQLNKIAYLTSLILVLLGAIAIMVRWTSPAEENKTSEYKNFQIKYSIRFLSSNSDTKISLFLPNDTSRYRIASETMNYQNLVVGSAVADQKRGRRVVGVALRKNQPGIFTASFKLVRRKEKTISAPLVLEERQFYLKDELKIQRTSPEIIKEAESLLAPKIKTRDLIMRIFEYSRHQIERSSDLEADDALTAITEKKASTIGRARAMVALCRASDIPARLVTGFILLSNENARPYTWVEVFHQKKWHAFDPAVGYAWKVPDEYYPVVRNQAQIATGPFLEISPKYQIEPLKEAFSVVKAEPALKDIANLERLPVGMRNVVAIVLLLPLGALITAVFRNFVGLATFGTFAPSLLALSFVMSDWRTGLVVLISVLGVGVIARGLLDRLKLLMVPRLGIVLTMVIGLMTLAISIFDYFNLTPSANAVLLPTVILAIFIERLYVTEIEDGTRNVVKLFFGTVLVSATCFFALNSEILRQWVIRFPETLLIVIALLIIIGRYSGYRFMELFRFKDLVR